MKIVMNTLIAYTLTLPVLEYVGTRMKGVSGSRKEERRSRTDV